MICTLYLKFTICIIQRITYIKNKIKKFGKIILVEVLSSGFCSLDKIMNVKSLSIVPLVLELDINDGHTQF